MKLLKISEYRNGVMIGYAGPPDPGVIYVLRIDGHGINVEKLKKFVDIFKERVNWMRVLYGTIKDGSMYIVMEPEGYKAYQIPFTAIITVLPEILGLIGVVMTGASLYVAISSMPIWAKIIGIIGVILMLIPILIGAVAVSPPKVEYKGKLGEKVREKVRKYKEKYW